MSEGLFFLRMALFVCTVDMDGAYGIGWECLSGLVGCPYSWKWSLLKLESSNVEICFGVFHCKKTSGRIADVKSTYLRTPLAPPGSRTHDRPRLPGPARN